MVENKEQFQFSAGAQENVLLRVAAQISERRLVITVQMEAALLTLAHGEPYSCGRYYCLTRHCLPQHNHRACPPVKESGISSL